MLQQANKFIPAITLAVLITSIYVVSNTNNQMLSSIQAQQQSIQLHQQDISSLQSGHTSQDVRLTRLELEVCSQRMRNQERHSRMVQCP